MVSRAVRKEARCCARGVRWRAATWIVMALASLWASRLAPVAGAAGTQGGRDDSAAEKLGWRLGVQTYTFRSFTLFEAIDKAKALGLKYIEMYPGQKMRVDSEVRVDHSMRKEDRDLLKQKLRDAGIKVVNYGVVGLPKGEAAARVVFDFARDMGVETIVSEPGEDAFDTVEQLCDEYGINVALHNHPQPSQYWNPEMVLKVCQGRSLRIGACADIGHWMRSSLDPLESLRKLEGRIVTFHFKDLIEPNNPGAYDVPWGTGAGNAKALFAEVRRQGFTGMISIEYEADNPQLFDNVGKCVAFLDQTAPELARQQPAETGAVQLFNGKDLTGWTFSSEQVERTFLAKNGVLVDKGSPAGYIRTEKDYRNFILRLELRHLTKGNGGVLVRMVGPDKVWPKSIECQGMSGDVGDIFNIDQFPAKADPSRTEGRRTVKLFPSNERPLGEWNTCEIIADGGEIIVKVNGMLQNSLTEVEEVPGRICLQSEGAQMEFQNIRLIPLPERRR